MSVNIPRKTKTFEYEGATYTLRRPRTKEMAELARLLSAFNRSKRQEQEEIKKSGVPGDAIGDIGLFYEAQAYIVRSLLIDPETGEQVFGPAKNTDEVDIDFTTAAWIAYNDIDVNEIKKTEESPLEKTDATTTLQSEGQSSEPQNTSE